MQRVFLIVVNVYWLLLGAGSAFAAPVYKYAVTVPTDLTHFEVTLCFTSPPPNYLYLPEDATASQFQNFMYITAGKHHRLTVAAQRLSLAGLQQGDCLAYTAVFDGAITQPWFKSRQSTQSQIQVTLEQWLLLPSQEAVPGVSIDFHLPQGFDVSAPGKLIRTASGRRVYQLRPRSTDMEGDIAVGRFEKIARTDKSSHIEIALLQGQRPFDRDKILHWIDANLNALRQLYGHFPVTDLQLLVVPVGKDREPVPWGESTRGGGDAVHVYIDETRPLEELMADWVLIHELSHLLHPAIRGNGNWLSEGLASYYQNVLAARAGFITEQQAWDNLNSGFARGIKGTPADRTLAQVAASMRQNRLFMRVYWSGAAMSLLADSRLRVSSHNQQSLDTVLQQFARCCLPADKEWTALALMQKYDALSGTRIFTDLYHDYVNSTQFPQLQPIYMQLGLIQAGTRVDLLPTAPAVEVRHDIMRKHD